MTNIKTLWEKLKKDIGEYYVWMLVIVGLPLIAYIYSDWRLALTVFIISQIAIGLYVFRKGI